MSCEAQELKALKKELRDVTIERDILKRQLASFPRVTYKISIVLRNRAVYSVEKMCKYNES